MYLNSTLYVEVRYVQPSMKGQNASQKNQKDQEPKYTQQPDAAKCMIFFGQTLVEQTGLSVDRQCT